MYFTTKRDYASSKPCKFLFHLSLETLFSYAHPHTASPTKRGTSGLFGTTSSPSISMTNKGDSFTRPILLYADSGILFYYYYPSHI